MIAILDNLIITSDTFSFVQPTHWKLGQPALGLIEGQAD